MNKIDKRMQELVYEDEFKYLQSDAKDLLFYVYFIGEDGALGNASSLGDFIMIDFDKEVALLVERGFVDYDKQADQVYII